MPREWTAEDRAQATVAQRAAVRERHAVLDALKAGTLTFDDLLVLARESKPVGRLQMHRVLKMLGWSKRQFVEAVNEMDLPISRRLQWWSSHHGQAALVRLREFMDREERRVAPEGFPFRRPEDQVPVV